MKKEMNNAREDIKVKKHSILKSNFLQIKKLFEEQKVVKGMKISSKAIFLY